MKPLLTACTAFAILWTLVPSAQAQGDGLYRNPVTGNTFNNPLASTMDTVIHSRIQRDITFRSLLRKQGYSDAEIGRILRKSDKEVLAYVETKKKVAEEPAAPKKVVYASHFERNPNRMLILPAAEELGKTEEEKSKYRIFFAQIFDNYEKESYRLGCPNDVAGTMAFYAGVSYMLHHPGKKEVRDAEMKVLVRHLRVSLDTAALRKASDEEKQKLYERYLILAGYSLAIAVWSEGDAEKQKALVQLGGDGLRYIFKVDPSRVKLTDNGVEITTEK